MKAMAFKRKSATKVMSTNSETGEETFCISLCGRTIWITAYFHQTFLIRLQLSFSPLSTPCVHSPLRDKLLEILQGEKRSLHQNTYMLIGTPFQLRVWHETAQIPYGATVTYGELAKTLKCNSPRAVGQALKKNPLPIIIPCHRVVGKKGNLTGFSCGLDLKRHLLEIEKSNSQKFDTNNK